MEVFKKLPKYNNSSQESVLYCMNEAFTLLLLRNRRVSLSQESAVCLA